MVADEDRDRRRLVPLLVLVEDRARVARHDKRAHLARTFDLQAVKRDVAHPGVRVARDHEAGGDVGRLLAAGDMGRQLRQIDLVAFQNDIFDRPGADQFGRMAQQRALGGRRKKLFDGRAVGERRVPEVRRRHAQAAPFRKARHVLEQQRFLARLVEQGAHLGVRVHGLGDADELAGAVELVDPRAHVLGHDLSSYETPSETSNRFMIQALYLQPARRADYIRALFTPWYRADISAGYF